MSLEFWQWLIGGGALTAAVSGAFTYHRYVEKKIEKKADKDMVTAGFGEVKDELHYQRDKLDELKNLLIERLPRD